MRTLIHVTLFLLAAASALAHRDRIEHPEAVTISFKTGERVTFALKDSTVTAVTLHVGSTDYEVPAAECAKLRDIRFESIDLEWNGSYKSAAEADYFYLRFDMGTENTRAFGDLPKVDLTFRNGKFAGASVRKNIAQDTSQGFDL